MAIALGLAAGTPALSQPTHAGSHPDGRLRHGHCLLVIDGKTRIDGPCKYSLRFYQDERAYFEAAKSDKRTNTFAYLDFDDASRSAGERLWNGEDRAPRATVPLGRLTHHGACWINPTSKLCLRPREGKS